MKKRIFILAVIIFALGIAAVALVIRGTSAHSMPSYQGRTADQWLAEVFTTNQTKALEAFSQMGTNAFPFLIKTFRKQDTAVDKFYRGIYPKLPAFCQRRLTPPVMAQQRWSAAEVVLLNNPHSQDALPQLLEILTEKNNRAHSYVLGVINRWAAPQNADWVPALVQCLEEDDPSVNSQAAFCLAQIGGQAKAAIPQLTAALRGTNDWVRVSFVWALWNIDGKTNGAAILKTAAMTSSQFPIKNEAAMFLMQMDWKDPELIPVYTSIIQTSDDMMCIGPVMALQKYGPVASNAVPMLVQRFEQTGDLHLKQTIWQALMEIDADEAAKHRVR